MPTARNVDLACRSAVFYAISCQIMPRRDRMLKPSSCRMSGLERTTTCGGGSVKRCAGKSAGEDGMARLSGNWAHSEIGFRWSRTQPTRNSPDFGMICGGPETFKAFPHGVPHAVRAQANRECPEVYRHERGVMTHERGYRHGCGGTVVRVIPPRSRAYLSPPRLLGQASRCPQAARPGGDIDGPRPSSGQRGRNMRLAGIECKKAGRSVSD